MTSEGLAPVCADCLANVYRLPVAERMACCLDVSRLIENRRTAAAWLEAVEQFILRVEESTAEKPAEDENDEWWRNS